MRLGNFIAKTKEFKKISKEAVPGKRQLITGISGSARTAVLAELLKDRQQPLLVVTDNLGHLEELADDFSNLLPADQVFEFPVEEVLAAEVATSSPNYRLQRVQALNALSSNRPVVVVTSVAGMRRNVVSPAFFAQATLQLKVGGEIDPEKARQQLSAMGYQLQKMVLRPGDFAVRGSIIDIYALNTDNPVRVDLFDTEIDSLRYFDASTQKSIDNVKQVEILPATDLILPPAEFPRVTAAIKQEYDTITAGLQDGDEDITQQVNNRFTPLLTALKDHQLPSELLEFGNLLYPTPHSLIDYLGDQGIIYLDDFARLKDSAKKLTDEDQGWLEDKAKYHQLTKVPTVGNDFAQLVQADDHAQVLGALFKRGR